ncbi:HEAT repeat domain-containing protein [Aquisphaera insulae]|uniref:HEAT repeat domain-containing protein n=1 Tax=Aquisphaera insulae TaxID=2712864 RepID=UPI0013E9A440|nr:HEAT repeat domain-containing protein [Aquisphaera insulae]
MMESPNALSRHPGSLMKVRSRILSMMSLVGCGLGLLWMAHVGWQNGDLTKSTVDDSIRTLRGGTLQDRLAACRELARFGVAAQDIAVPVLIKTLRDPEASLRLAAAEALGQVAFSPIKARQAAGALRGALEDSDPGVRIAAVDAIGVLSGSKQANRDPALEPKIAIDILTEALDDRDVRVRSAIVKALALVGPATNEAPPPPLIMALDDESEDVRANACLAIARFKQGLDPIVARLFQALSRLDPGNRTRCVSALCNIEAASVSSTILPTLLGALDNRDMEAQYAATYILVKLAPDSKQAIPALIKVLTGSVELGPIRWPAPDSGRGSAIALGELAPGTDQSAAAITALTDFLRRADPTRRDGAADALGRFSRDAAPAIPVLINGLRESLPSDASFTPGTSMATALGRIAPGTPLADQAMAALAEALDAKSRWTRLEAVKSLAAFGPISAAAVSRLRRFESDPDFEIRHAAAVALKSVSR